MNFESIPFGEVYYPTVEEFSNFQEYVNKLEENLQNRHRQGTASLAISKVLPLPKAGS